MGTFFVLLFTSFCFLQKRQKIVLTYCCCIYMPKYFYLMLYVINCFFCCKAEELERAVHRLKLSEDDESNDDMFSIIISSLECEGKRYKFC